MGNDKFRLTFTVESSGKAPYWSCEEEHPKCKWKESDYCRGAEIFKGEIIFQYRNDTHGELDKKDFTLKANGQLERIEVLVSIEELKDRIFNIESQGGQADISNQVLDTLTNKPSHLSLVKD